MKGPAKNHACLALVSARRCKYHRGTESMEQAGGVPGGVATMNSTGGARGLSEQNTVSDRAIQVFKQKIAWLVFENLVCQAVYPWKITEYIISPSLGSLALDQPPARPPFPLELNHGQCALACSFAHSPVFSAVKDFRHRGARLAGKAARVLSLLPWEGPGASRGACPDAVQLLVGSRNPPGNQGVAKHVLM